MDIERALFRSYEASLFSCVHDNPRRSCKRTQALCCIELVFLSLGLSLALVLVQASMIRSPLLTDLLVAKLEYDMHHINASSTNSSSSTVFLEETVMYLSLQGEFTPAYVFSLSKETGRMGATLLMQHDFPIIHANVSLCSTQFKGICEWLPQDDMVVGQLMRDFSTASRMISVAPAHSLAGDLEPDGRRFGYVRNLVTLDEFIWDRGADSLVVPHLPVPVPQLYRLLAVCKGAFLFFIISATAAMFFRALITSGMVMMYLFTSCCRRLGLSHVPSRLLSVSFPWIGAHVEELRRLQQSPRELILAHACYTIVLTLVFEATEVLYGLWVSENPLQQNVQPAVFFMVMFAEYFSLVYCRSKTTIRYFPRFFCLGFLTLHLYLLASPNGYYGIASAVYGCFTVFLALHFVRVYEVPALRAGEVSETQPRAFVVRMVTPQLPFEIPPFWTLFHPVSRPVGRAVPVLAPPPVAPPQHPPDPVVATVIHVAPEAVADPVSEDADIDTLSPRLRAVGNRRVLPFPLALPRLSPTRSRTPAAPGLVSASADHAEGDSLLSDGNG